MGFWDNILGRRLPVALLSPRVEHIGGQDLDALYFEHFNHRTVAQIWASQPHLRTVVTFLARNVAQLGLHTFERATETDRKRDRTSPLARILAYPDGRMTNYDLIYALVGDLCLYDRAYWYLGPSAVTPTGLMLRRIPPSWVSPVSDGAFEVPEYLIAAGTDSLTVPSAHILDFTGYSPTDPLRGSPTIEALKDTLQEQIESSIYRRQVWRRGGRVSSVLERPAEAPKWSDAAREAFREDWYAKYTGHGAKAGGTPILEDGMTLRRIDFNAQEQQYVEAAKLSLVTVAAAFHVNPTMVGQNDGANYSNVREFRKMLYGDTLGPLLAQIEARINTFLLPMLGMDPEQFYGEFNIAEKLQGSFEEQAKAMQTATGAPWMTRAEARARMNLPTIDGADELIVPLNVVAGGQASPTDSGSQNTVDDPAKALATVDRAERSLRSLIGAKSARWWDGDRWRAELGESVGDDLADELTDLIKDAATAALRTQTRLSLDDARERISAHKEGTS